MNFTIIKRDNKQEVYVPEKIIKVVKAAGLSQEEAEKLTSNITNWLKERRVPHVTSLEIKDRVIVEIQKINKAAADKFIWYEKTKDKEFPSSY